MNSLQRRKFCAAAAVKVLSLGAAVLVIVTFSCLDSFAQIAPAVTTDSASDVKATTAILGGTVSPEGSSTTIHFDYGTSDTYGSVSVYDTMDTPGNSLYFNGSSAYASTGGLPKSYLYNTSFTVEAWAKRYPDGKDEFIFSYGSNPATDQLIQFGFRDSTAGNVFTFGFYGDDLNTPVGYTDTLWHQWVGVYNLSSDKRYIYRDGVLVASDSPTGYPDPTSNIFVGMALTASNGYFKGDIAEVRLWNTALSQSTIQTWMYRGVTSSHPDYGNLIGYWKMDEDSGSVAYDSSGQGNKLFLNNTQWLTPDWTFGISTLISGLSGGTLYHYRISATNSSGTTTGDDSTFTTLPGAPSQAATNLSFPNVGEYSATINWTNGNGQDRIVILKQGAAFDTTNVPADGSVYAADSVFMGGSEIGSKSYVVYSGTSNTVTVTGLLSGREYIAAVYELNDLTVQPQYQTVSPAEGTCFTTTPLILTPATATGSAKAINESTATLSGTVSTNGGQTVFGFNYGPTTGYGYKSAMDTIDDHSKALLFDAADSDEVSIPSGINLSLSSFTIMAWAKRYTNGSYNIILGQGETGMTDATLQFGFRDSSSGDAFTFGFYNDDLNTPAGNTDTLWHFWVGVYDASTNTRLIYRDGVLLATDNPTGFNGYENSGSPIVIGANSYSNSGYFNGKILQVTILNAALSQSQILQWMYRKAAASLPDDGNLVGEWIMNEGSGLVAGDSSGNVRDGTIKGATWTESDWPESISTKITGLSKGTTYHYRSTATNSAGTTNGNDDTFTTYAPAYDTRPGYALHFDGSSSYVDIANSGTASQFNFTGPFTIEGWFKVDSFKTSSSWTALVTKGDGSWRIQQYQGTNNLDFGTTGLSDQDLGGTTNVNDGKWHFFAAVYDGSRKYLYVDGRLDTSVAVTGTLSTDSYDVALGSNLQQSGRLFGGDIDEVRIWDVARTEEQVRSDMFSTIYNTASGLIDYWQFDEGAGTATADSVSDFNGTLVNSPAWVTSDAPVGGYGTYDASASTESAGPSGNTVAAALTSPADSLNFVGLYEYGSPSDTAVTNEVFPSGVVRRSPVIWGIFGVGNDTGNVTLDYSGLSGIQNEGALFVLERDEADSPWVNVTSKFSQNTSNHTFTLTGIDTSSQFAIGAGTDNSLPVEATDFVATSGVSSVTLTWKTQSEINNAGFNILRVDQSTPNPEPGITNWRLIASYTSDDSLRGLGTSSTGRSYDFTDNQVISGETYIYKIEGVSTDGATIILSTLSITVNVPKTYALYQNYPNPFNPSTTIRFDLKEQSNVALSIYSVLGQQVESWNYGSLDAGRYDKSINMARFGSGVYIYRIIAVGKNGSRFVATRKLMLLK